MCVQLIRQESVPLVGGSTSPFIDKGDGFTSEREKGAYATEPYCPRLPSLVAHTGGYQIMVGAYNIVDATVEYQDGYRVLLRTGYGL